MGTEDVQTVRDGPNTIRLKTPCRESHDVRITQVHGLERRIIPTCSNLGNTPVSCLECQRWKDVPSMHLTVCPCPSFAFALHPSLSSIDRPVIDQSSWPTTPPSVTYRPPSGPRLPVHLSSPINGRANRPLTLKFTIKKVIDYINPRFT